MWQKIQVKNASDGGYRVTHEDGQVMHIRFFPGGDEYERIQRWIEEGNTPEPEFTLEEIKSARIQVFKDSGGQRVFRDFDAQGQRRLALEDSTHTGRVACKALIGTVRTAVRDAIQAVNSATSEAEVEAVTLNLPA